MTGSLGSPPLAPPRVRYDSILVEVYARLSSPHTLGDSTSVTSTLSSCAVSHLTWPANEYWFRLNGHRLRFDAFKPPRYLRSEP